MRRQLATLVAAAMALVLVAFLVPLAVLVRTVAQDRAISKATVEAQSLTALVATAEPQALRLSVEQLAASTGHPVTVFLPDGTVLGTPMAKTAAVELAARGRSFSVDEATGREILVPVEGLPGGTAVIRSFVPLDELRRGVNRAWLLLALLGAALLALGVFVADRLAVLVVRPIGVLARVSHRLAAGDLDARAEVVGPPEVRGVAAALNHLAGRIRELLRQEREAVADLSHRMRTPLTALRLDAEGLPGNADRARMLDHVAALDRAVTGVIEDARQRGSGPVKAAAADAVAVVAAQVRFWSVLAEDQDRALHFSAAPGPLPVALPAADLAACVDALLGNVFSHTPVGAPIAIRLQARPGGGAVLVVEDGGPGFARGAARDPDPAGRGHSGGGSTGLGLDIVGKAAATSGGELRLGRSALGGALVSVGFGRPR